MSILELEVNAIAGSSIEDCVRDILSLSRQLDLCVHMKFNGTLLFAHSHETEEEILRRFKLFLR